MCNDLIKQIKNEIDIFNKNIVYNIDKIDIYKIPIDILKKIYILDIKKKKIYIENISLFDLEEKNLLKILFNNKKYIKNIYEIILKLDLDLNIKIDKNIMYIKLPVNTEYRRKKLAIFIQNKFEIYKIRLRMIRRDYNNINKNYLNKKKISKDIYNNNYKYIEKIINENLLFITNIYINKKNKILNI